MGDADVQEHLRAVFVPLIRERTVKQERRVPSTAPVRLSGWKPFQATHSETRPTVSSPATLFNLVPCNRELEVAFTKFVSDAPDVAAFAKNAGPQALRIDYLASGSRLAFYTPDFFVRGSDGNHYLVETKGREDKEVPAKAKAAVAWGKAASSKKTKWSYVYVQQGTFERLDSNRFHDLMSLCQPNLSGLLAETTTPQLALFARVDEYADLRLDEFIPTADFEALPARYKKNISQAVMLFRFTENKENLSFAPAFTPLIGSLEDASNALLVEQLTPFVPSAKIAQRDFFAPDLSSLDKKTAKYYDGEIKKLERTLVFRSPISPMGHLKFVLDTAFKDDLHGPLFDAIEDQFGNSAGKEMLGLLTPTYSFRNKYIAHHEHESVSVELARPELGRWTLLLVELHRFQFESAALRRYRQLIDKKYVDGLTGTEAQEVFALRNEIDAQNERFYKPIIEHMLKSLDDKTPR